MPTQTKSKSRRPRRRGRPVTNIRDIKNPQYSPELAKNWSCEDVAGSDEFTIRDEPSPGHGGPIIATIKVNSALTDESRKRIAWLMSCAPALWQTLRKLAPYASDMDAFGWEDFSEAVLILTDAANNLPYSLPTIDELEEELQARLNAEALRRAADWDSPTRGISREQLSLENKRTGRAGIS